MFNNSNVCTMVLIALVVMLFCYKMSQQRRVVVIEPRVERFESLTQEANNLDLNIKSVIDKTSGCSNKYNIQGNRYLASNKGKEGDTSACMCGQTCNCDPNNLSASNPMAQWLIPYEPGANGTVQDLQWQYMNPRMTLVQNCLNSNDYKPGNRYNTPIGVDTDSGRYSGSSSSRTIGFLSGIPGGMLVPASVPEGKQSSSMPQGTMSQPMGTGIHPMPEDELSKLVNASNY